MVGNLCNGFSRCIVQPTLLSILLCFVVFPLPSEANHASSPIQSEDASDQKAIFTVGVQSRILYGEVSEQVYSSGVIKSELLWPMKPSISLGGSFSLLLPFGMEFQVTASALISDSPGILSNSDYLNGDGVMTHYSQHHSTVQQGLIAGTQIGWNFNLNQYLAIQPFIAFSYLDVFWKARDGYLQYPPESDAPYTPWSDSLPKLETQGDVISYNLRFYMPKIGVRGL
ncbi:MAG: omptin family outer membrane protease [Spirochaetota bacterium]